MKNIDRNISNIRIQEKVKFLFAYFLILFALSACSSIPSSKELVEAEYIPKFSFSVTKSGFTTHIVDKFNHIQITSNIQVKEENFELAKQDLLHNSIVQRMCDSLNKEMYELNIADSIKELFTLEFDDHLTYCQIHKTPCIFRYYRFVKKNDNSSTFYDEVRDDIWVNGLPVINYPIDSLLSRFGEPDSTNKRDRYEPGEGTCTNYYYGLSNYSVDKGDSLYYLETFVFNDNDEAQIGGFTLNNKTTLEEVAEYFPLSWLNKESDDYKSDDFDKRVRLLLKSKNGQISDDQILLYFKKGKLYKLKYYIQWV